MTTTNTSDRQTGLMARKAGWVAFAIAIIVTAQGVFLLFNGLDQGRFERKANVEWAELEQAFPTVTDYLSVGQTDRTLAITVIAFGLQASLLFWFRDPQRPARCTRSALGVPGDASRLVDPLPGQR